MSNTGWQRSRNRKYIKDQIFKIVQYDSQLEHSYVHW